MDSSLIERAQDGGAPGRVPTRDCDVLVIGGGPGGAATAILLARQGLRVTIVEQEAHPRFHIGESLLPHSLPILEDLGVLDQVREIGVYKPGAEFISADGAKEAIFLFGNALLDGPDHAYQVRRAEFDKILFDKAVSCGVHALEKTTATVLEVTDRGASIRTRSDDGQDIDWQARVLIDASGRSTITARQFSEKKPDPKNDSAAIFGHFHGVPRAEGDRGGNIRVYLTDPGWMWQIPLQNGVTSIGLVANAEYLTQRTGGIEAFFNAHCDRHPHLAALLADATPDGPLRATGNFSYRAGRAWGPGHVRVGDAFGFIDPVFSTGVHMALTSAQEAAVAVGQALDAPARRHDALTRYHNWFEKRLNYVSWMIYKIHDPTFRNLMVNPRNFLGVEQAVISLLAGDFRPDPRIRLRIALFKFIRYMSSLKRAS